MAYKGILILDDLAVTVKFFIVYSFMPKTYKCKT